MIVRGQRFYDNKHRVNDDPDHELHGQPKRFSLREVHPITEFFVCMRENCDPTEVDQGTPLQDVQFRGKNLCAQQD